MARHHIHDAVTFNHPADPDITRTFIVHDVATTFLILRDPTGALADIRVTHDLAPVIEPNTSDAAVALAEVIAYTAGYTRHTELFSMSVQDTCQELAGTTVQTDATFADVQPGDEIFWLGDLRHVQAVARTTIPAHVLYRGVQHNRPQTEVTVTLTPLRRACNGVVELSHVDIPFRVTH